MRAWTRFGFAFVAAMVAGACEDAAGPPSPPTAAAWFQAGPGNRQVAPPGSFAPILPTVVVRDSDYVSLGDVAVVFEVVSGGGAITGGAAVTAPLTGAASVTSWRLGPAVGDNVVRASMPGFPPLYFHAFGGRQDPGVTVDITTPATTDTIRDEHFVVEASVSATEAIASVVATVGSTQRSLQYVGGTTWKDSAFSATAELSGPVVLQLTATTASGAITDDAFHFLLDRPPQLVGTPGPGFVVRAPTPYQATCIDEAPTTCFVAMYARRQGDPLYTAIASGYGGIAGTISFDQWEGSAVQLRVDARDRVGYPPHRSEVGGLIYIEKSTRLAELARTDGHLVHDVNGGYLAYHTIIQGVDRMAILDTMTGQVDTIPPVPSDKVFVTSTGEALFVEPPRKPDARAAYLWRAGQLSYIGDIVPFLDMANDRYVQYRRGTPQRLDLVTGVEVAIPAIGLLTASGDVLYEESGNIFRWSNGVTQQLNALPPPAGTTYEAPTEDGSVLACRVVQGTSYRYAIVDGAGAVTPFGPTFSSTAPGGAYRNGWLAWTVPDAVGIRQVWRRTPGGVETQVSNVAASATVVGIGPDGAVIFTSSGTGTSRRYHVGGASTSATNVSGTAGFMLLRSSRHVLVLGRSLFEFVP